LWAWGSGARCAPYGTAEYAELDGLRTKLLQQEIDKGLEDIQAGRVKDGKEVMQRLRKKVRDARL
jgi:predicted transcriptional regulator